jgi:hypothetical protein
MKPSTLMSVLPALLQAQRPVFIWGSSGAGKSSVVRQFAAAHKLQLTDLRASQLDAIDVRGFPVPDMKNKSMEWLPADFFPRKGSKPGILFLDEMNGALPATASAFYQLILDRRVGQYELPDNWGIIAAGNNASDRGVTHQMPAPLNNRFCHIDYEIDAEDWQQRAQEDKIHMHIRAYHRFKGGKSLHVFDSKINPRSFPTPRSWYFADQIYKSDVSPMAKKELIEGTIGTGAAVEFLGFVKDVENMPDLNDVKKNPATAMLPKSEAVMHAVVTTLVDDHLTATNYESLMKYITRLRAEIQVVFNRSAFAKEPRIATSRTYIDWALKNQDVIR